MTLSLKCPCGKEVVIASGANAALMVDRYPEKIADIAAQIGWIYSKEQTTCPDCAAETKNSVD